MSQPFRPHQYTCPKLHNASCIIEVSTGYYGHSTCVRANLTPKLGNSILQSTKHEERTRSVISLFQAGNPNLSCCGISPASDMAVAGEIKVWDPLAIPEPSAHNLLRRDATGVVLPGPPSLISTLDRITLAGRCHCRVNYKTEKVISHPSSINEVCLSPLVRKTRYLSSLTCLFRLFSVSCWC
jgi:hypothetical protein